MTITRQTKLVELMDNPSCDEEKLLRTLRHFRLLNILFSRYRTILSLTVLNDMLNDPEREYHLVDLGAGGCDIAAWLLHKAENTGLKLRITAIDSDPRIVRWAKSKSCPFANLTIREMDAGNVKKLQHVDYIFANHFFHHLKDEKIVAMLKLADQTAARGIVVSDLLRSRFYYCFFTLLAPLLFPRSFIWYDGRVSIKRSFHPDELLQLSVKAGLKNVSVNRFAPGRIVLSTLGSARK